jgi:hypothetical protein
MGLKCEEYEISTNYNIYAITRITENKNDLRAYIGIARNYLSRKNDHTTRFKIGKVYKMESIFNKIMTINEAKIYEIGFISDYILKGYKLFNVYGVSEKNRCYTWTDDTLNDKKIILTKEEKKIEKIEKIKQREKLKKIMMEHRAEFSNKKNKMR